MKRVLWFVAVLALTSHGHAQKITSVGHATMTLERLVVSNPLTLKADTVTRVANVEWGTEAGTAARRMAAIRKAARIRQSEGSGFYDRGDLPLPYSLVFDFCYFTYKYPSVSANGEEITLSSIACMPDNGKSGKQLNNVIVGCHATITDNKECPSQFKAHGEVHTDVFVLMAHAGYTDINNFNTADDDNPCFNNLVILPDYEGYGESRDRAHPYLCGEATARQVADAVRYGIELYKTDSQTSKFRRNFRGRWRTICEGYSQGAAVAMATQRYIEKQGLTDELRLVGSVCGGGPYNLTATILNYMERDLAGEPLALPVVIPLILMGLCDYSPWLAGRQVSDYLNERFLETGILDWLSAKDMTTTQITNAWQECYIDGKNGDSNYFRQVLTTEGKTRLSAILKPAVYDYFKDLLSHYPDYATRTIPKPEGRGLVEDLHLALESNNLTADWTPEHTIALYHSTNDDVVPIQNAQCAQALFGEKTLFYPSAANDLHTATGTEFYTSAKRDEAITAISKLYIHPATESMLEAYRDYKDELMERCEDLLEDDDSEACQQLVFEALTAISSQIYDQNRTLDDNKAVLDDIVTRLKEALAAQRAKEQAASITSVETSETRQQPLYDLQGRRVDSRHAASGLYIRNRRKYLK